MCCNSDQWKCYIICNLSPFFLFSTIFTVLFIYVHFHFHLWLGIIWDYIASCLIRFICKAKWWQIQFVKITILSGRFDYMYLQWERGWSHGFRAIRAIIELATFTSGCNVRFEGPNIWLSESKLRLPKNTNVQIFLSQIWVVLGCMILDWPHHSIQIFKLV